MIGEYCNLPFFNKRLLDLNDYYGKKRRVYCTPRVSFISVHRPFVKSSAGSQDPFCILFLIVEWNWRFSTNSMGSVELVRIFMWVGIESTPNNDLAFDLRAFWGSTNVARIHPIESASDRQSIQSCWDAKQTLRWMLRHLLHPKPLQRWLWIT